MAKLVKINNISGVRQIVPGHGSAGPGYFMHVPEGVAAQLCAGDNPAWELDKPEPKKPAKAAPAKPQKSEVSDVAD